MTSNSANSEALFHFPVGLFTAFLLHINPALGCLFGLGFISYEVMEDWRIHDKSYLDLYGWLLGLGLGGVILWLL